MTPMDTSPNLYEYVMAQLDAKRVHQRVVAAGSGVPFSTVTKIAQRRTKNPGFATIQRLADYFTKVSPGETPAQQKEAA